MVTKSEISDGGLDADGEESDQLMMSQSDEEAGFDAASEGIVRVSTVGRTFDY